jgi:hypothetical protein
MPVVDNSKSSLMPVRGRVNQGIDRKIMRAPYSTSTVITPRILVSRR